MNAKLYVKLWPDKMGNGEQQAFWDDVMILMEKYRITGLSARTIKAEREAQEQR